ARELVEGDHELRSGGFGLDHEIVARREVDRIANPLGVFADARVHVRTPRGASKPVSEPGSRPQKSNYPKRFGREGIASRNRGGRRAMNPAAGRRTREG